MCSSHYRAAHMSDTPFELFDIWFAQACETELNDPNAMALATADAKGRPSVRMVLLKGHDPRGFVFYTNFEGRKAGELFANANAALLFHWKSVRRQIRIEGAIEQVDDAEADAYFATRGRDSQLGAWASDQSRPLDARETFLQRFDDAVAKFDGGPVPRPPFWGGFRLISDSFEFWQDREHRLHERRTFKRDGEAWREGMLYP
jgi:pyridoxamine 5'-phosphate oxidase